MIRHCCAACGRPINRTDRFFESSDGTLCQHCLAQTAPGNNCRAAEPPAPLSWAWASLPVPVPHGPR